MIELLTILFPYHYCILIAVHVELEPVVAAALGHLRHSHCDLGCTYRCGYLAKVIFVLRDLNRHFLGKFRIDTVREIYSAIAWAMCSSRSARR